MSAASFSNFGVYERQMPFTCARYAAKVDAAAVALAAATRAVTSVSTIARFMGTASADEPQPFRTAGV